MVEFNVAVRILDFLKDNVKADLKTPSQSSASFNQNDQVYEVQQQEKSALDDDMASIIELSLMLLSNLSVKEVGQKHLLGEGKTKGAILDILYGMFSYFKANAVFDFTSNIIANVSALKEGREHMLSNKILQQEIDLLKKVELNGHRRRYLVESVRNMLFEYEAFETLFLEIKIVESLNELLVKEWERVKACGEDDKKNAAISMIIVKQMLDCLVLVANSEKLLKVLTESKVNEVLEEMSGKGLSDLEVQISVL